jgi:hypothetical protein
MKSQVRIFKLSDCWALQLLNYTEETDWDYTIIVNTILEFNTLAEAQEAADILMVHIINQDKLALVT